MKIYIVRHGQTDSNKNNKLLGKKDEDINETGYKQILNAKRQLDDIEFDICFSSPYKRTMITSKIITNGKCMILIDNRLSERGFGILEGGSANNRYTPDFWDYYLNKSCYGVEPLQDLFKRTKDFIEYLKLEYNNKCILIVSHAATIRALHYNITCFNENTDMLSFRINNCQILKYDL